MAKFAFVPNSGMIQPPTELPTNWQNISNLAGLSTTQLHQLGWYRAVETIPDFDMNLEKLGEPILTTQLDADGEYVQAVYPVMSLSDEERAARRVQRYAAEADPYLPEAEVELRQGRPQKYFDYMQTRFKIRRETEPEATRMARVIEDQLTYWKTYCDFLINAKYPATNRDAYKQLMDDALAQGLTNRAAYLRSLNDWCLQLFSMFYSVAGQIMSATTVDEVLAAAISTDSVAAWEAADPKITFAAALAIPD